METDSNNEVTKTASMTSTNDSNEFATIGLPSQAKDIHNDGVAAVCDIVDHAHDEVRLISKNDMYDSGCTGTDKQLPSSIIGKESKNPVLVGEVLSTTAAATTTTTSTDDSNDTNTIPSRMEKESNCAQETTEATIREVTDPVKDDAVVIDIVKTNNNDDDDDDDNNEATDTTDTTTAIRIGNESNIAGKTTESATTSDRSMVDNHDVITGTLTATKNDDPNHNHDNHSKTGKIAIPTKRNHKKPLPINTGRWSENEHKLFLEGLELHGREWKSVAANIGTRSVMQTRTHAQKYFDKLNGKISIWSTDTTNVPSTNTTKATALNSSSSNTATKTATASNSNATAATNSLPTNAHGKNTDPNDNTDRLHKHEQNQHLHNGSASSVGGNNVEGMASAGVGFNGSTSSLMRHPAVDYYYYYPTYPPPPPPPHHDRNTNKRGVPSNHEEGSSGPAPAVPAEQFIVDKRHRTSYGYVASPPFPHQHQQQHQQQYTLAAQHQQHLPLGQPREGVAPSPSLPPPYGYPISAAPYNLPFHHHHHHHPPVGPPFQLQQAQQTQAPHPTLPPAPMSHNPNQRHSSSSSSSSIDPYTGAYYHHYTNNAPTAAAYSTTTTTTASRNPTVPPNGIADSSTKTSLSRGNNPSRTTTSTKPIGYDGGGCDEEDIVLPLTNVRVQRDANMEFLDLLKANMKLFQSLQKSDQYWFAQNVCHFMEFVRGRKWYTKSTSSGNNARPPNNSGGGEDTVEAYYPIVDPTGAVLHEFQQQNSFLADNDDPDDNNNATVRQTSDDPLWLLAGGKRHYYDPTTAFVHRQEDGTWTVPLDMDETRNLLLRGSTGSSNSRSSAGGGGALPKSILILPASIRVIDVDSKDKKIKWDHA